MQPAQFAHRGVPGAGQPLEHLRVVGRPERCGSRGPDAGP